MGDGFGGKDIVIILLDAVSRLTVRVPIREETDDVKRQFIIRIIAVNVRIIDHRVQIFRFIVFILIGSVQCVFCDFKLLDLLFRGIIRQGPFHTDAGFKRYFCRGTDRFTVQTENRGNVISDKITMSVGMLQIQCDRVADCVPRQQIALPVINVPTFGTHLNGHIFIIFFRLHLHPDDRLIHHQHADTQDHHEGENAEKD